MTRSADELFSDILEAVSHARLADRRLRLGESLGDEEGVQVAFESILHNLFVIAEAVKALPPEMLERHPDVPWNELASMRDVIGHRYHRIVPAIIHRTVEDDLGSLEKAVKKMRSGR